MAKVFCDYDGTVGAETKMAIQIRSLSGFDEHFLPKSQIGVITYKKGGDSKQIRVGETIEAIQMEEWLAKKKGLI